MFDTENKNIKLGRMLDRRMKPLEKIKLKHLTIAFTILGVGCFFALVVFLFEMIGRTKVHNLQQANDSENTTG